MTQATNNGVEVERDGVKLGWNVLAIMASIGLGLYVTSIVSPIRHTQAAIQSNLNMLNQEFQDHADHIISDHAKYSIAITQQEKDIENLEEDVADLKSDIKSLKGKQP